MRSRCPSHGLDGTTSNGVIEARNGEFWFSAVRSYTGKAPPALVSLRFVSTVNSKIIGSFEIKPQSSTMLDPAAPSNQAPAPNQRHGDAAPAHHANRAIALHAPSGSAVTQSDLALMFGAGAACHRRRGAKARRRSRVSGQGAASSMMRSTTLVEPGRAVGRSLARRMLSGGSMEPVASDPDAAKPMVAVKAVFKAEVVGGTPSRTCRDVNGWHWRWMARGR